MLSYLKKTLFILLLLGSNHIFASGGYDNGTPAGKGNLDLEMTLNPFNYFKRGQSYVVWGYGLTDKLDFHGYFSYPASGVSQLYSGFMYNFISNKYLDLSTAIGLRFRSKTVHPFFPQLLYTIKLPKGFDVIGSMVLVYNTEEKFRNITTENISDKYKGGITYDIAVRASLPFKKMPSFIREAKIAVGAFRGVSHKWYPTYSIDLRINLPKRT